MDRGQCPGLHRQYLTGKENGLAATRPNDGLTYHHKSSMPVYAGPIVPFLPGLCPCVCWRKGYRMEFAVFILLLLIIAIFVSVSPFICVLSIVVDVPSTVLGLVARVVRGLAGFVREMVVCGRDRDNRCGR